MADLERLLGDTEALVRATESFFQVDLSPRVPEKVPSRQPEELQQKPPGKNKGRGWVDLGAKGELDLPDGVFVKSAGLGISTPKSNGIKR